MSLPSVATIAHERGLVMGSIPPDQAEGILVEAMRRDLPGAVALLHAKAHEASQNGGSADWLEDPNSEIGKQLIRLHASDAMRPLASKHFCHGKALSFVNCCKGVVGTPPADMLMMQIETQMGPIAYADC
jgi:hypothetical protein